MANCFYTSRVISELIIDEDKNGLVVLIPSENEENTSYIVRCDEHKSGVTAKSCSCKGFYYRSKCKHVEIVQSYWDSIYKPVAKVAAPAATVSQVKKERKPRNGLVRKVRNGGLVRVEQKQPAKVAKVIEQAISAQVPAKKDMMSAALTRNAGFSLMR